MTKDAIYLLWLTLLTIAVVAQLLVPVIMSQIEYHKTIKRLKNEVSQKDLLAEAKDLMAEPKETISKVELNRLNKYIEINAVEKFKDTVNALIDKLTPEQKIALISDTVESGNMELIIFLHKTHGLDIHSGRYDTQPGEDRAFKGGYFLYKPEALALVKYFLDNGSDVHADEENLLYLVAQRGHLEIVKLLVEYGAQVSACERAAIIIAEKNGYPEIAQYLIEVEREQNANLLENSLSRRETAGIKKKKI